MAISTITIADTIEWAKRLSYNHDPGISNGLQPALANANIVMQTILSPPFDWWWNNREFSFNCSTTPATATITNISLTSNIVTITAANTFSVDDNFLVSGVGTATFLNGKMLTVLTATSSIITATFTHGNYASAADTGTLTDATTQDYTLSIPNFSHISHVSLLDTAVTPNKWWELTVKNDLAFDSNLERPQFINPQSQDSAGNVTFRLMPAPALNYPVAMNVQMSAPLITSLNSTWSPIPDFMQYIYNWGFLALQWAFTGDPRVGYANTKFTSGLLARAEGLTEEERNIFLNNWNDLTGSQQQKRAQGMQARQV